MHVGDVDRCELCHPTLPAGVVFQPDKHPECGLRLAVGGIGHLTNHDYWCCVAADPDMGLTWRESSVLVAAWVREHGIHAAVAIGPDCDTDSDVPALPSSTPELDTVTARLDQLQADIDTGRLELAAAAESPAVNLCRGFLERAVHLGFETAWTAQEALTRLDAR